MISADDDVGVVVFRDGAMYPHDSPPFMSGVVIDNPNPWCLAIQPYGIVMSPFGTYKVPDRLVCPIHISRIPSIDLPERTLVEEA